MSHRRSSVSPAGGQRAASAAVPPGQGALSESTSLDVGGALALVGAHGPVEAYVDLQPNPIRVRMHGGWGIAESWDLVGPRLQQRVLAAVAPLLAAGWRLDGTFSASSRWDVSVTTGPDLYVGCWVRVRRDAV